MDLRRYPDDECADAANDEHDAPAETGDEQGAGESADGEAGDNDGIEDAAPAAAGLRREKSVMAAYLGYEFGAESNAHDRRGGESARGMLGANAASDGGEAEDDEVCLIGEARPKHLREKPGAERTEHHAHECDGNELCVLRKSGKAGVERGAEDAGGDVDVVAVEDMPMLMSVRTRR